jgi:hypothetical protein
MKRTNDLLMFLLIGLASIVTVVTVLQRPPDLMVVLASCGFTLFTLAWTGMYFRLKRDLPQHALVDATYLNLPTGFGGGRRAGLRNMFGLVQLHFERRGVDRLSILLIAGLAMLAVSLIGAVL